MKRNPDTPLANWALEKLAEYIATRRDLDNADPRAIETALKKAGKLPAGDHYYTAYHAGLKALQIRRKGQEKQRKWVHLGTTGAGTEVVYYEYRHEPCGTVIEVLQGFVAVCPKCQPKEWEEAHPAIQPVRK